MGLISFDIHARSYFHAVMRAGSKFIADAVLKLWRWFWGLAGSVNILVKIMGIVFGVLVGMALAVAWYVNKNLADSLEHQLVLRGRSIGERLAAQAGDRILTEDTFTLHQAARTARLGDRDVSYIYVQDWYGHVIVHTFEGGFPRELLRVDESMRPDEMVARLETAGEGIIDVAVPIVDGKIGMVHIGFSMAGVTAAVRQNVRFLLIALPIALLVGLGLAYLLASIIRRALANVVSAAERVGHGDLTHQAPVWARDEIGRMATAFNEMTGRLRQSHEQLLRRHREMSVLHATARATSRSLNLEAMLREALDGVSDLMGLRNGRLCLFGEEGSLTLFVFDSAMPQWLRREPAIPMAPCTCREMLADKPYRVGPLPQCPRIGGHAVTDCSRDECPVLCIPLRVKNRISGILHLDAENCAELSDEEIRLLVAVTEQIAVGVESARLWDELRDRENIRGQLLERVIAAQEEERRRVARELHDELGQVLTTLLVELRALEMADAKRVSDKSAELRAMVSDLMRTVQQLALELRPSVLDDVGLVAALRRYTQDYASRHFLKVDFQAGEVDGESRLRPAAETAIYRIIQEALTNVARHAGAARVRVHLIRRGQTLVAIVEDDGKGFDFNAATARSQSCLGIRGMQERATLVGGRLSVESERDAGTTVFVEIPLDAGVREDVNHG